MADIYRHDAGKFLSQGLMLRTPVDLVPVPFFSRHDNVTERIEGQLSAREGITSAAAVSNQPVHTIFRLNEQVPSVDSERLAGVGSDLYAQDLTTGSAFSALVGPSYDGNPLQIVNFRFANDPAAWAIIGNSSAMMKQRQPGLYQVLGQVAPTVAPVATDFAAGLLNSTGGPGYDWVYTYMNGITRTESNPSPAQVTALPSSPTTNVNSGVTNPANAYDGNPATYALATAVGGGGGSFVTCTYKGWGAPISVPSTLILTVIWQITTIGTGAAALCTGLIEYSTNAGVSWNTIISKTALTTVKTTTNVTLPSATDMTQLQVRISATGEDPGGLLSRTLNMEVYEIYANASQVTTLSTLPLVNREAQVCVVAPTDPQQDIIRLFRRGGSLVDGHYLAVEATVASLVIGTCGAGTLAIIDNVPDTGLGTLLQLDNDVPVSSVSNTAVPIPYIWGQFQSMVLGCGDTGRPDAVYFSKPENADAWPPQNWVTVSSPSEPMMGGCVYNTRCFAFSTERLYELVPGLLSGVTFSPYPTPCGRGLISPWGLCVSDAIYFVAKDGVYRTEGGVQQSLVEDTIKPLFPTKDAPGESVDGYEAVDLNRPSLIRLDYHNDELYFSYAGATTGSIQQIIWDTKKSRWRAAVYSPKAHTFYSEPSTASSLLIAGGDGVIYSPTSGNDGGTDFPCGFRTGAYDQSSPLSQKEYGNVLFDIDPGGATLAQPVTITPYINGDTQAAPALTITGSGRQQVPLSLSDVIAYNIAFDVAWTRTASINPVLYQRDILWRPEPTAVTHWEVRESSYGIPGYFHLRDGYMGLRSTATTVLTVWGDNVQLFQVTFASTSNARQRIYFACPSNKAKEFRFSLDAQDGQTPFRVYIEDMVLRAKPFITLLGYKELHALGADAATIGATIEGNIAGGTR